MDLPPELGKQAMGFIPPLMLRFNPLYPDNFYSSFYDQSANLDHLMNILTNLPIGTSEIMCHPGFVDQELLTGSSYNYQRERELEVLKNPDVTSFIQNNEIHLINYSQL
jgi:predicted glycoside hydrolase/deacetylase ChbG (UPF0249 family)